MNLPPVVSQEEWVAARTALLEKEKEATRARDRLNAERRMLPMVEVTKEYAFTGPNGRVELADLFEGRRQLIVYHFMFHPEWEDGCPSCTAGTSELGRGFFEHLRTRDTTYALVSRAPLERLERWKAVQGWDLPWYSAMAEQEVYPQIWDRDPDAEDLVEFVKAGYQEIRDRFIEAAAASHGFVISLL